MGCGQTLGVSLMGYPRCTSGSCPRPQAVEELLASPETDHIVLIQKHSVIIQCPLHERLNGSDLFSCPLQQWFSQWFSQQEDDPVSAPGLYRAQKQERGSWDFRQLDEEDSG